MDIERIINSKLCFAVFVLVLLAYLGVAITYDAIELQGLFLFVFFPALISAPVLFSIIALVRKKTIFNAARTGLPFGAILAYGMFLSNFIISTPYRDEYTVSSVSIGRGSSVNWNINTKQRDNVILYVNAKGIDLETSPTTVKLLLNRGWLGFYFGNIAKT